jgi:hypothetical protein
MSAPHGEEGGQHTPAESGVWLTDREPGELLGPRRVIVQLQCADSIAVAEVETREEAIALAERTLTSVDEAAHRGEWVELADRLVRPDAIESVDVELVD